MNTNPTRTKLTTILALLLVPLLVAGGFLWGTWNSTPRLREVRAAVVNLDEMVEVNGQKMPLGRQLAAELVDSEREQNLTWVLADEKHAKTGLADGTYAAVVTIPPGFSAAATSFSGAAADAVQATIRVETSPVTGVSETALGQHLANAASNSLNRFLTGEYLKNIYVGFNEMGDQFNELKDGTAKLADGAGQLADGTRQAASGADKLSDGLGQAAAGGGQLRSGAHQLADGGTQLGSGAHQLADGTTQWATGARTWASGSGEFTVGLTTYADGVHQYTDGVAQYVGVVNPVVAQVRDLVAQVPAWGDLVATLDPVLTQLDDWADRIDPQVQSLVVQLKQVLGRVDALASRGATLSDTVDAYAAKLTTTALECPADLAATPGACDAFTEGVTQAQARAKAQLATAQRQAGQLAVDGAALHDAIVKTTAAADRLAELSTQFKAWAPTGQQQWVAFKKQLPNGTLTKADVMDLLNQFVAGGDQLITGGATLASGADQLVAGSVQLTDGATQLASGADQLASGTSELATGADKLAAGQVQYAAGIDLYTDGIGQAASGSRTLADGVGQLGDGATELSDGTRTLADGVAEGAGKIPHYTDDERENLATVVASPISTDGLDALVVPTVAWASLLLVMALWIGALASYSVFRAVDPRNLTSSHGNARLLWRSVAPGLAVVATQGVALAALGAVVLGLDAPRAVGVGAVALLASAAFVAVNHALAGWFGTSGRVASLAFLVVTVVSAIASSAPGTFGMLRPLSPLSPALDAVRMVLTGQSVSVPLLGLVAWLLLAAGASYVAVVRSRTVKLAALAA